MSKVQSVSNEKKKKVFRLEDINNQESVLIRRTMSGGDYGVILLVSRQIIDGKLNTVVVNRGEQGSHVGYNWGEINDPTEWEYYNGSVTLTQDL